VGRWGAEKLLDGYAEDLFEDGAGLRLRLGFAGYPSADGAGLDGLRGGSAAGAAGVKAGGLGAGVVGGYGVGEHAR
jgi:hypothetical protein